MITIAIAGGTGGVGQNIVDAIVRQGSYKVLVLSRQASTRSDGALVIAADYSNVDGLKDLLQENNVSIVISALGLFSQESADNQLNLINASVKSGTVTKFIPSEFGIKYTSDMLSYHPAAQWWLDAAGTLRNSPLQFTRIILGWFLDYYCMPAVPSHLKPFSYALDFRHRKASIPGDGSAPVSFLHSNDMAEYIVAILEQDQWPEFSPLAGDRMSWNEFFGLAEEVTQSKWEVTYDSVEVLNQGKGTVLPQQQGSAEMPEDALQHLCSEFGLMACKGVMDVTVEGLRNDEFPHIKPLKVREAIQRAWAASA